MEACQEHAGGQRLDSWLWCVRLCRSRTLAAEVIAAGGVRINRRKVKKPAARVRIGDVITVAVHGRVHVVEVLGFSSRRVSATVAAGLCRPLRASGEADATGREAASRRMAAEHENRV